MSNDIFFKRKLRISPRGAHRFFGVKKNSYAASVINRIYDYYCRGANNLYLEYVRYYRKEFSDFEEFLSKKYNLFSEEIDTLKSFLLYHKDVSYEADGHITDLVEDPAIKKTLCQYLGVNANDD